MTFLKYILKKLRKTFKVQKELLKAEMNHDEIDEKNYKDKKTFGLIMLRMTILCTAFCYARYSKAMEESTGFSMKGCSSIPGLGWE